MELRVPCSITAFWSASLIDLTGLAFLKVRQLGPLDQALCLRMYVGCPRRFHCCGNRIIPSLSSYDQADLLRGAYFWGDQIRGHWRLEK